jgi:hypothetical protein
MPPVVGAAQMREKHKEEAIPINPFTTGVCIAKTMAMVKTVQEKGTPVVLAQ